MKKVSIVILNWNGEEMLRKFLPAVLVCSSGQNVEVCVADNGSTDASCRLIEEEFPSVRLIRLDQNYGFAEGYNRALDEIEAEYVVLLNSDVEVTSDWLKPLVAFMDTHPEVGACQPKLLSYKNREYFEYAGASGGFIDKLGYPFCRGRIFDTVEKDRGQYDTELPIFWATGAALMVRLSLYKEVGGLDGRFFAHMEEIDLCWRLRSRGHAIYCVPQSSVYHVGGATLKKENPRKTFLNFRNNLLMLYKNLPENELRSVMFQRMLLDRVAAFVFFLKGDFGAARAVSRARKQYNRLRPRFEADRRENLRLTVDSHIAERVDYSILWKNKLHGVKLFSDL